MIRLITTIRRLSQIFSTASFYSLWGCSLFRDKKFHESIFYFCYSLLILCPACKEEGYHTYQPTKADSIAHEQLIKRACVQLAGIRHLIRNGDLVTRTGNDFTSESIRSLNRRDKTYSHCGIASIEHDSIFIYHALGGDFNPDQKIRRDPFELFAEPYSNKGTGIFRFHLPDSITASFAAAARRYYQSDITFDMDFNLLTDNKMYCSEFVYKSLLKGSKLKLHFNLSRIGDFEFIGVDDLCLHPDCKPMAQIVYK